MKNTILQGDCLEQLRLLGETFKPTQFQVEQLPIIINLITNQLSTIDNTQINLTHSPDNEIVLFINAPEGQYNLTIHPDNYLSIALIANDPKNYFSLYYSHEAHTNFNYVKTANSLNELITKFLYGQNYEPTTQEIREVQEPFPDCIQTLQNDNIKPKLIQQNLF